MLLQLRSEHRCFGGVQRFYEHASQAVGLPMRFAVYLPPQVGVGPVPALVYLAGLTCNEETFPTKGGAQALAAELGIAIICPDTSPRGSNTPGEADAWDFGLAAGFYLDATREPWARHWRMESWLVRELLPMLGAQLPIDTNRLGLMGHSMGGHGALSLGLRHPTVFRSVSALAPICAPSQVPWGIKAFSGYLGDDPGVWAAHDTCGLLAALGAAPWPSGLLVDQGLADKFLTEQLRPDLLEAACAAVGQPLTLRRHAGYDHGYYFVQTVIGDHLRFHQTRLA